MARPSGPDARALAPLREPPIAFAFGLFAGLLALLFMRALGTPGLDRGAYRIGVALAAAAGVGTAWAIQLLRRHPRLPRLAPLGLVIAVGAALGMGIQWLLLVRAPAHHAYILAGGFTTGHPVAWVLEGALVGVVPALVAAGFLAGAQRLFVQRALDARERVLMPFAAASALLGSLAFGAAGAEELVLVACVVVLALVTLGEILVADLARGRWLRRVFGGEEPAFEIVARPDPLEPCDLPHVVAAVRPLSLVVYVGEERGYRAAARTPLAATGVTAEHALAPLRQRQLALLSVVGVASLLSAVMLVTR
jgi:hypothetical protein